MNLQIKKLNENAVTPTYGTVDSAGADLYACIENDVEIIPGETKLINTGISMAIPSGYVGLIYARSSLGCKKGIAPANKVGVIDADYRGEILVALHNHSNETYTVTKNERIAQIVITPYLKATFVEAETLDNTNRGEGGFGSTN